MDRDKFRFLEVNGGVVDEATCEGDGLLLRLPPVSRGYADAQIDDYGRAGQIGRRRRRRDYPWRPGLTMRLEARFSHEIGALTGTAGFGFWNAPFGDPSVRWPALPQATWFFYASAPGNLPFAATGTGRGWFAATIDAGTSEAIGAILFSPAVLLLNQFSPIRRRLWPALRRRLQISFAQLELEIRLWHAYTLKWQPNGCAFMVDGRPVLETEYSPRGPLGFVCWIDNQYLVATNRGRIGWGTLAIQTQQWLEIKDLEITPADQ